MFIFGLFMLCDPPRCTSLLLDELTIFCGNRQYFTKNIAEVSNGRIILPDLARPEFNFHSYQIFIIINILFAFSQTLVTYNDADLKKFETDHSNKLGFCKAPFCPCSCRLRPHRLRAPQGSNRACDQ